MLKLHLFRLAVYLLYNQSHTVSLPAPSQAPQLLMTNGIKNCSKTIKHKKRQTIHYTTSRFLGD